MLTYVRRKIRCQEQFFVCCKMYCKTRSRSQIYRLLADIYYYEKIVQYLDIFRVNVNSLKSKLVTLKKLVDFCF